MTSGCPARDVLVERVRQDRVSGLVVGSVSANQLVAGDVVRIVDAGERRVDREDPRHGETPHEIGEGIAAWIETRGNEVATDQAAHIAANTSELDDVGTLSVPGATAIEGRISRTVAVGEHQVRVIGLDFDTQQINLVAADEGWMPQSEEHMAVLDLLDVNRGVVALTRIDVADPDIDELAHRVDVGDPECRHLLHGAPDEDLLAGDATEVG